ncbi:amastin-like surface protein-like protein [Leishmania mexicana MHOM/GT/2001/U1103]|uniref:Amastin-like surface protein-like protein n=1 Tax=Leishmania mexicana (strain MHOM/GT/2001/U1103) TaxID=929439 RepID=E9B0L6_LEIMU|nr:amastin-like surface protein-like protein [Leishmania mexicana MHOM/GT/2001/U1103]CBZ28771.1 amastin-like surface protein-like protein [Leishmania mexicana MHOM/GT/2001/U1103]
MANKKSFYNQEYRQHVGAVILFIVSFLTTVFTVCGTPLGMLMIRSWGEDLSGSSAELELNPCFTLWGLHSDCSKPDYSLRITDEPIINCSDMHVRFEAAEAFSILAIFSLVGVFGASWYMICGSKIKKAVMLLAVFAIGSTTVPWAIVTAFYYTPFCGLDFLTNTHTRFGAGYALLVTSFVLQIIGLILFVIFEPDTSKKRSEENEKGAASEVWSSTPSALR